MWLQITSISSDIINKKGPVSEREIFLKEGGYIKLLDYHVIKCFQP